ncbi:hypothetical protein MAPG_10373, partial [Magnaporthiopsis poae ATCC 64411]
PVLCTRTGLTSRPGYSGVWSRERLPGGSLRFAPLAGGGSRREGGVACRQVAVWVAGVDGCAQSWTALAAEVAVRRKRELLSRLVKQAKRGQIKVDWMVGGV